MNVKQVIPPDAIPSIDDPQFTTDYSGERDEQLVVVEGNETVRGYPIRVLNFHEIVNDVVDGQPVAVTWCPLCGSTVVYDRCVDGTTLTFGVSGTLADDDLVMFDRETDSSWKQSLGRAIAGEYEGTSLTILPATRLTLERFEARYPDGEILVPPGGESEAASDTDEPAPIEYERHPYQRYFEMEGFGLGAKRGTGGRDWAREDFGPKEPVLGVTHADAALGFPESTVEAAGSVVMTTVDDLEIVVFATPDGLAAFENPGYTFERVAQPGVFAADETRWDGATGESEDGRSLTRVAAQWLFAFSWQDDHGPDAFFTR
ncbi:DUF3179 domain-containing protein [Haladaptatus sp. DJG-WS-42]|uniref:DUF3179 domain-containing protein n=1 Tax=Haladaptatus sp. DJG-WS-42 TaxID=3120516 RepID=UPI0030CB7EDA